MPQLNPTPWLMFMMVSWLTLLALFSPKTISTLQQNSPSMGQKPSHKASPWNWPWT